MVPSSQWHLARTEECSHGEEELEGKPGFEASYSESTSSFPTGDRLSPTTLVTGVKNTYASRSKWMP